jgi:hypothetical protein
VVVASNSCRPEKRQPTPCRSHILRPQAVIKITNIETQPHAFQGLSQLLCFWIQALLPLFPFMLDKLRPLVDVARACIRILGLASLDCVSEPSQRSDQQQMQYRMHTTCAKCQGTGFVATCMPTYILCRLRRSTQKIRDRSTALGRAVVFLVPGPSDR